MPVPVICPGCGGEVPFRRGPGQKLKWCSRECRESTYRRERVSLAPPTTGHPTTSDRGYDDSELEWLKAIDRWKRANRNQFPTACQVLEIARSLGYRKG